MVITIEYTSGRMCEYNMSTLCASDPWSERGGRPVVMCEFDLRLDLLMSRGELRVDVIRHAMRPEGGSVELEEYEGRGGSHPRVAVAARIPTVSMTLASEEEMRSASVVYVSSAGAHKPVAWRQGTGDGGGAGWLVNGVKFESVRRLYYSDSVMSSTSHEAVRLFGYLRRALPAEVRDEEIADVLGFPMGALEEVIRNEAANADGVGESVVSEVERSEERAGLDDGGTLIDVGAFEEEEDDE